MSDDWDSVTRIGSNVRRNNGAATQGPKVVRGASALNAANRMGGVVAEKKYGTTNQGNNTSGQFDTKVDRSDDIIATKKVPAIVSQTIADKRKKDNPYLKRDTDMSQSELATLCSVKVSVITEIENGSKLVTDKDYNDVIGRIESRLNVKLRGNKDSIGKEKFPNRNK